MYRHNIENLDFVKKKIYLKMIIFNLTYSGIFSVDLLVCYLNTVKIIIENNICLFLFYMIKCFIILFSLRAKYLSIYEVNYFFFP